MTTPPGQPPAPLPIPDQTEPAFLAYVTAFRDRYPVASQATGTEIYWLLKAYLGLDQWRDALPIAEHVEQTYADDIDLRYLAARCQYRAGRLSAYHAQLHQLSVDFPDHPGVNLELAKLLLGSRDPELAAKYLNLAKTGAPLHPEVLLNLAYVRFFLNEHADAKIFFERFLEVAPDIYPYHFAREIVPTFLDLAEHAGETGYSVISWLERHGKLSLVVDDRVCLLRLKLPHGRGCNLIFDTGGGYIITLSDSVFQALNGVPLSDIRLHGIGGQTAGKAPVGQIPRLAIGPMEVANALSIILDLSGFEAVLGTELGGIIGPGLLLGARVTLDLEEGQATVSQAPRLSDEQVLGFGECVVSYPQPNQQHLRIPMFMMPDSKPALPVHIAGEEFWFLLDTGADRSFLSASLFQKLVPEFERQQVEGLGVGDSADMDEILFAEQLAFTIGDVPFIFEPALGLANVETSLSKLLGFEFGGILGYDWLLNVDKAIFDFRNAELTIIREVTDG